MAGKTQYHQLPDDNRPSLESIPGDEERLLNPLEDELYESPPKKRTEFNFSHHPTFFLRLLNVCLLSISLSFFIVTEQNNGIAAIVFICLALLRNVLIVFRHFMSRWVHFRIELVGSSKRTGRLPAWLKKGAIQVIIDLLLFTTLIITVSVASKPDYWWRRNTGLLLPGCILGWISLPIQLLAAFDTGNPRNVAINGGIWFGSDNDASKATLSPQSYRDIEVTAQPAMIDRGSSLAI